MWLFYSSMPYSTDVNIFYDAIVLIPRREADRNALRLSVRQFVRP